MSNRKNARATSAPTPTSRDLEIIRTVCRHGALTREQLRHLCFRKQVGLASVQAACRRLKFLVERGYLDRLRVPTVMGSGPYIYLPAPGSRVALTDDERDLATRGRRSRISSLAEIKHGLDVVDFYVALQEGLASQGGRVIVWLSEREAHHALPGRGRSLPFTPDAYCLWLLEDEEGAFFLEWDRGTESMTRIAEKLTRYEKYYGLRAYREHLGEQGLRPRLLFVLNDERRRSQVGKWLARRLADGRWPSLPTIFLAVQDDALAEPLGAIWTQLGQEGTARFLD